MTFLICAKIQVQCDHCKLMYNFTIKQKLSSMGSYHWRNIMIFNPLVTNGLSHPYHIDESILIFRDIRSIFSFLFHFSMKFMSANGIAPNWVPRFAASHLGLFCLPMRHKKDARLI